MLSLNSSRSSRPYLYAKVQWAAVMLLVLDIHINKQLKKYTQ